jgi:spore germination protein YaaH
MIVNETNIALKKENPGYQVSVCAAWDPGMPSGIDGRAYDYKSFADVSDFLYVMQYDTRS